MIEHDHPVAAGQQAPDADRDGRLRTIVRARTGRPGAIAEAAARRIRPDSLVGPSGKLMVIAADHPARGSLRAGSDAMAMADRADLLDRMLIALSRPGVNGVLGTADLLEDLLLLGALDRKVVVGSMNRGGLAGTCFEIDDRFTGYNAETIDRMGFEMGKMLLRIDPEDPATVATMEACATAVSQLAARQRVALVEPFISHKVDGRVRNDLSTDAVVRSVAVAAGLGTTSAYTWLKLPVVDDDPEGMERVLAASTLPAVLLGGEVPDDPDAAFRQWEKVLRLPTAMGLVVGRTLLYPPDGDVAGAVDTAVSLL
ncbi:Cgl0159 family (beta/alpha)8-fold protein [Phytoactinopolyspora limicola]|uniref:Cgl0159 family (beta/alpha)8-fold protein n=1 Tax=Phytoactinopolyspora limicola TaxID=2715536 RepID=UPI003CCD2885